MKRINNLEREGVYSVAKYIEKHLNWTFREQPVVDVGLDGIIEECILGIPTGRFIGCQIKSGLSNVYKSKIKKECIYYASNIHVEYWLSVKFPVVLILYNDKNENLSWKEINNKTLVKTNKGWKVSIENKFDTSSLKENWGYLLNTHYNNLKLENPNRDEAYLENLLSLKSHSDCSRNNIDEILKRISIRTKEFSNEIINLSLQKHRVSQSKLDSTFMNYASFLEVESNRIIYETDVITESFGKNIRTTLLFAQSSIKENEIIQFKETLKMSITNLEKDLEYFDKLSLVFIAFKDFDKIKNSCVKFCDSLRYISSELSHEKDVCNRILSAINNNSIANNLT